MRISCDKLIAYGGFAKKYEKGSLIFREGANARFLYQIMEGEVKVYSTNTEGKEIIQGIFETGETFGEPPLFVEKPYPSSALASMESVIIKIAKDKFLILLNDYPEIATTLLHTFATRIYNKASSVQILLGHTPEEKILGFLNHTTEKRKDNFKVLIPYTRQQIADFTGLRVETVIRTLTRMSREKKVDIIDHKVYY